MKEVKRFADIEIIDKGIYTHWVEYTDGTRESCTWEERKPLFDKWLNSEKSTAKYNDNGLIIFEF